MEVDQRNHYLEMRQAYLKRLRILELKEAQLGIDTPSYIIAEISDLRTNVNTIDSKLSIVNSAANNNDNNSSESHKQVEIVFRGSFERLTPEIQNATIRAIAAILEISFEEVKVMNIKSGSVVFKVELPTIAAEKLVSLYETDDPSIKELDISSVSIIASLPLNQEQAEKELLNLVQQILSQSSDNRLVRIFELWVVEDASLAEIGRLVSLDPSRVVVLLQKARQLLRENPDIKAWAEQSSVSPQGIDAHKGSVQESSVPQKPSNSREEVSIKTSDTQPLQVRLLRAIYSQQFYA